MEQTLKLAIQSSHSLEDMAFKLGMCPKTVRKRLDEFNLRAEANSYFRRNKGIRREPVKGIDKRGFNTRE